MVSHFARAATLAATAGLFAADVMAQPAALVDSVSITLPGVAPMDYLAAGTSIDLGKGGLLVIDYLASCIREEIAGGVVKTVAFIFISPLLGFLLGSLMMVAVSWICRRATPSKVDRWFRRLQLVSAGAYSLGHGGNDAQKTIGIIWMLLIATGYTSANDALPPTWTIVACYTAIAAGTLFGGWRIVKTMGQKITKLKPVGGFCAETGGAITLFLATALGIPVSTTHTITGAIVGVGSTRRASAVRWGVAGNIVWAWILTIPASAFVAAIAYWFSLQIF